MQTLFHKAGARGYAHHGWLKTYHSFSFAHYYDPEKMGFGALRVINDDAIAPGKGFGKHPHANMEIITIPLSGALAHEDSMGNKEVIKTGEVQVMSAGTGVEHSEFNASETEPVTLLQIWIMTSTPEVMPRYAQQAFDQSLFKNNFHPIVGPKKDEKEGGLYIHQNAFLSLARFDTDTDIEYTLRDKMNGTYFFVIEGTASVGETALQKRDALGVWDTTKVFIQAKRDAFLLAIEVPMGEFF